MATQDPDEADPALPLSLLAAALAPLLAVGDATALAGHVADLLLRSVAVACRIDLWDDGAVRTLAERPAPVAPRQTGPADDPAWVALPLAAGGSQIGELRVGLRSEPGTDAMTALVSIGGALASALSGAEAHRQTAQVSNRLQQSLLPSALPRADWFELAASYAPATAGLDVGGDWYDAQLLPAGELALSVGDVAGHGVEAAARMGEIRSAIAALRLVSNAPDKLIGHLHRICDPAGYFATAICARLSPRGVFRWSSAGHLPPIVARAGGTVELVVGRQSPPLGAGVEGAVLLNECAVAPGDTVLLYTDGLVERRDEGLDTTIDHLVADIAAAPSLDPSRLVDQVVAVRQSSGPTLDDIAVLAARLVPGAGDRAGD